MLPQVYSWGKNTKYTWGKVYILGKNTLSVLPGLDWPLCHRATEQWLTILLRYEGTMASPSLVNANDI